METTELPLEPKAEDKIADNKETIMKLWGRCDRPGIKDFLSWLEGTDFFTAPSSAKFHLACPGGLAQHSLNVYNLLIAKMIGYAQEVSQEEISAESLVICGLGHDLCKVDTFKENGGECSPEQFRYLSGLFNKLRGKAREKVQPFFENGVLKRAVPPKHASTLIEWAKTGGQGEFPELPVVYAVEDAFPFGHGEKSVSILQDFMKLSSIEKLAIRWHMGMTETGTHFFYPTGIAYKQAQEASSLVVLLHAADLEAAQVLERE